MRSGILYKKIHKIIKFFLICNRYLTKDIVCTYCIEPVVLDTVIYYSIYS